jgi:hypothetical protein
MDKQAIAAKLAHEIAAGGIESALRIVVQA